MNRLTIYLLQALMQVFSICIVVSCSNQPNNNQKRANQVKVLSNNNKSLIVKGDSLEVAIDKHFVAVPKNSVINHDSVYKGIYQINKDSINQTFSIQKNEILYFTTFENVGMGYRGRLYAYDLKRKNFLTNHFSKDNYVYSSAGIFFLNGKYIFSVCKPNHENAEDPFTTAVEIFRIGENKINYIKYITLNGEMADEDSSIIKLYKKAVKYKERNHIH